MLKIKSKKSPTLGGTMTHFANQFQGLEIHEKEKKEREKKKREEFGK